MNTLPSSLHLLLATLTARLTQGMLEDDRHRTRRTIGKLAVHFFPFGSELGRSAAQAQISHLLLSCPDEELSARCLEVCNKTDAEAQRERQLLDIIPEVKQQIDALIGTMEGKR